MTVVNPKSISGINSITTGSGSDNLLTIHTSDANNTERVRVNSSGDVIIGSGVTLSPDGDMFATGITTVSGNVKVGTGITLSPDGDVFATGVCTATSFSGDGSNLTGISAGVSLSGSTDNTVATVTGANAITGEANLKFDGSGTLTIVDTELAESTDNFSINIQSGNNDFYVKSGGTTFAAFKGSAKDLQLTSGNLVIATSGKGIDFSATGDGPSSSSELLDDYEEGTYTPTISSGMASIAYDDQAGNYVKVGKLVQFDFFILISSGSYDTNGAHLKISLPFNQSTSNLHRGFGIPTYHTMQNLNVNNAHGLHFYIYNGAAEFYSGSVAVSGGNGTNQGGRYIIGGGIYHAA